MHRWRRLNQHGHIGEQFSTNKKVNNAYTLQPANSTPLKLKTGCTLNSLSQWVLNPPPYEKFLHMCIRKKIQKYSQQHYYSKKKKKGNNVNVHQQMNSEIKHVG